MNTDKRMISDSEVPPVVCVVDGDAWVRERLESLIQAAGWHARTFAVAEEFLALPRLPTPGCLILEVALPGLSGLQLQQRIANRTELPVVFLTADCDVQTIVKAMKAGAYEYLAKPCGEGRLLSAISLAIAQSRTALHGEVEHRALEERYAALSRREREVMALVVQGRPNKQIAAELGISLITVKAHRGRLMRKTGARSVPALVNFAARIAGRGPRPEAEVAGRPHLDEALPASQLLTHVVPRSVRTIRVQCTW